MPPGSAVSLTFEGRELPVRDGDTVASVLYRAGVRIFSRSFKYHRPRGLYCASGDCASCMLTVDGDPAVRACVREAKGGLRVERSNAWPSADHDLFSVIWHARFLLPVGFYYKALIRPKWLWPLAERGIRRVAGIGPVNLRQRPEHLERRNYHPDLCVIGGGVAGLSAALAGAERGESVVIVDEGRIGEQVAPGPTRSAIEQLLAGARAHAGITVLERAPASGIYEGPLVTAADGAHLHLVHPRRIVVATGAVELHGVFPGNDLPGVWLGRGAARMAGAHGIAPGRQAVIVLATVESFDHLATLRAAGVVILQAVVPAALRSRVPPGVPVIVDGEVVAARGGRRLTSVVVNSSSGRTTIRCDTLVLSLGFVPRDGLLRQAQHCIANGAGDVAHPGASLENAMAGGRGAAHREAAERGSDEAVLPNAPTAGFVCICEDVGANELIEAWREGYGSTELLKRYTTTTMGPCQGLMCHAHLRAFARARTPATRWSAATTARPPARGITLEEAAAGFDHHVEQRTALHARHLELGAQMGWAGIWKRPDHYGDMVQEYWAVRRGVSIMDVGTLGKFQIGGPDAAEFLERLYPMHVRTIKDGRSRYGLLLNEAGYIIDDGMVAALGGNAFYVTATSSGAEAAEAWMRDWAETWGLRVHVINRTAALGAINVAGPRSRELLARVTGESVSTAAIPYGGTARVVVAGVPCLALRVGFTGELSFELHHPSSRSVELWDALLAAGADLEIRPHGLNALKLLRLEKGHLLVGQDTDFDTTPGKVGMEWAVRMDKPYFVGKTALERLRTVPAERRLLSFHFPGDVAPDERAQLWAGDRYVGSLTSAAYSPALQHGIGLGWVSLTGASAPTAIVAVSRKGRRTPGSAVSSPFYDPDGARLRA